MTKAVVIESLRDSHKDVTRQRVRTAARQNFLKQGVDATSMEDIRLAAGISRTTLYQYYGNKQAILLDLATQDMEGQDRFFARLAALPVIDFASVRRWLRSYARAVFRARRQLGMFHFSMADNVAYRIIHSTARERTMAMLAERFPLFDFAGLEGTDRQRAMGRAWLAIMQVEQFCASIACEDAAIDFDAGLDLITEALLPMLAGE